MLGQPTFVARGQDYVTASATVTEQGTQATVNAITQASPVVVTTSVAHNFSSRDRVTLTGILGMIELNTGVRYYAKVLNTTSFELYADENFATPIDSTNYTAYASGGTAETQGGFRDSFQSGKFVQVEGLSELPRAGSNIQFAHLPNSYFKLVPVQGQLGTQTHSALLQVHRHKKVQKHHTRTR